MKILMLTSAIAESIPAEGCRSGTLYAAAMSTIPLHFYNLIMSELERTKIIQIDGAHLVTRGENWTAFVNGVSK